MFTNELCGMFSPYGTLELYSTVLELWGYITTTVGHVYHHTFMKRFPRRLHVKINSEYLIARSLVCLLQFGLYIICL